MAPQEINAYYSQEFNKIGKLSLIEITYHMLMCIKKLNHIRTTNINSLMILDEANDHQ
jgi:hypothetical protein